MLITAESVEQAVAQAIGAASMCWTEPPTSVFDSKGASDVVDALLRYLRKAPAPSEERTLVQDLAAVLNRYNMESGSDTPDFVLAEYLVRCLDALNASLNLRSKWYSHHCTING